MGLSAGTAASNWQLLRRVEPRDVVEVRCWRPEGRHIEAADQMLRRRWNEDVDVMAEVERLECFESCGDRWEGKGSP